MYQCSFHILTLIPKQWLGFQLLQCCGWQCFCHSFAWYDELQRKRLEYDSLSKASGMIYKNITFLMHNKSNNILLMCIEHLEPNHIANFPQHIVLSIHHVFHHFFFFFHMNKGSRTWILWEGHLNIVAKIPELWLFERYSHHAICWWAWVHRFSFTAGETKAACMNFRDLMKVLCQLLGWNLRPHV